MSLLSPVPLKKPPLRRFTALLVLALVAPACGGSRPSGDASPSSNEVIVKVASYDLAVGKQRFMVGLITPEQRLVGWGNISMKFAYLGTKSTQLTGEVGTEVQASYLPIPPEKGEEDPQPKDGPTIVPGAEGRGVYSAETDFDKAGYWGVVVDATVDGKKMTGRAPFEVLDKHHYPWLGEDAPRTENLTLSSADAPRAAIDSLAATNNGAIPDEDLHQMTVAQAITTGKPTLLVVSTPVYCTSRFCGPVTDVVDALAKDYKDRANFIHIEVWRNFQDQEVNKGAAEWVLRDDNIVEPWVWLIGGDGKIAGRWDNVATRPEIEPALKTLLGA